MFLIMNNFLNLRLDRQNSGIINIKRFVMVYILIRNGAERNELYAISQAKSGLGQEKFWKIRIHEIG